MEKNNTSNHKYLIALIIFIILSVIIVVIINKTDENYFEDPFPESDFPSIRIMVHNGCGFTGVAQNIRNSLIGKNIDVVEIGNTRRFIYNETIIVVKHDDPEDLLRLKRMTGIENVIYAVNQNYFVPFIIIAGRDYQKYF
jgi:hypothetical protein